MLTDERRAFACAAGGRAPPAADVYVPRRFLLGLRDLQIGWVVSGTKERARDVSGRRATVRAVAAK